MEGIDKFTPHPARCLLMGRGGYRLLKGPWDGEKGWGVGCSRIFIWEGGVQAAQGVFHGKSGGTG